MLARKTIGRDLPPFSGQLEEWGAFIFQFRQSNSMCGFSDAENLYRLQRSLMGKARETVSAMLVTPGNVTKIIEILEKRFGRPENIIQSMMKQVKNVSGLKEDKSTTIVEFGTFVQNLVVTIENLNRKEYLLNPQLLAEMVQKLPPTMRMNWGLHRQTEGFIYVSIRHYADWLENIASAAQTIEEFENSFCEKKYGDKRNENHRYRKETVCTIEDRKPVSKNCHFCNKSGHFLRNCKNFVKLHLDARWKWVKEGRRCFCCLETGHGIPQCTRKIECGLNDCDRFHHQLLHCDKSKKGITESEEKSEAICNAVHSIRFNTNEVLLGVLPVVLKGPAGEVKTFALTDDGSTATIIEESLADELGLTGPNEVMRLKALSPNSMKFPESRKTTLQIQGIENKEKFKLNARTVKNIELPSQSVNFKSLCDTFPYLKKVKLSSQENVTPRISIGSDNIHLIVSRDLIEGREDEPLLSKTKLGWIVKGNTVKYRQKVRKEYTFLLSKQMDEELHRLVKESFKTETFGVAEPKRKLKSKDEERADEILEKETRRVGVRWETALIWKCDDVHFPDSKIMALNRLKTVERKMDRDQSYGKLYCDKIQEYISKDYARMVPKEEIQCSSKKLFYLPHFGVVNPHKPGKLRIVFDAAAKANGVSLNDMLLPGPDLYNSLVGILMRFRRGKIAFIGDICEMFPQIRIKKEDLPAQRFLFRGMERNKEPDVYEMTVMLFGSTYSPASAQYVKNRNATEFKEEFPAAVETIIRNFFMDDYLDSVDDEEEAATLISQVIEIHRRGGFDLRSWICNSEKVLATITVEKRASGKKNLNMESTVDVDRVLGLYWNSHTDCFTFTTNFPKVDASIVNGSSIPTKREVLKLIMSVFDPLGIIANFTVKCKILLQEVWRSGIDWDDTLPHEINQKWLTWINELPKVTQLHVPRCYSSLMKDANNIQLHVFVDASVQAFCSVAYLRITKDEEVSTAFAMARTRVAPLKPITVPRLE